MAKRPSLHGTGREALAAATGHRPAAETRPSAQAECRDRVRARPSIEGKTVAPERPVVGSSPVAGEDEDDASPKRSQAPALKGAAAFYCELLGFGRERFSQALEAGRMLGECRNPAEAFEAQAQLARRTTEQCVRESFRMMELAAQAIGESWASVQRLGFKDLAAREAPPPK